MTAPQFAVPASRTRPARTPVEYGRARIVRAAWLIARFVRREAVQFEIYRERFGASPQTFRRDLAAMQDAGVRVAVENGAYRIAPRHLERGRS
jgi:predicted DNA-binding transcriptional regulator YafY